MNGPPTAKSLLKALLVSTTTVALFILFLLNGPRLPVNPATLGLLANGMLGIGFLLFAIRDPEELGRKGLRGLAILAGLLALIVGAGIMLDQKGAPLPDWSIIGIQVLSLLINVRLVVGLLSSQPRRASSHPTGLDGRDSSRC